MINFKTKNKFEIKYTFFSFIYKKLKFGVLVYSQFYFKKTKLRLFNNKQKIIYLPISFLKFILNVFKTTFKMFLKQ